MIGQTVRLFIKALIIGVLVNVGIQYVSTPALPSSHTTLHNETRNADFQATSQMEK